MPDETPLQTEIIRRSLDILAMHASVNEEASRYAKQVADKDSVEHYLFRLGCWAGSTAAIQVFADRNLIRRDEV